MRLQQADDIENLTALRETALRQVAEECQEPLQIRPASIKIA